MSAVCCSVTFARVKQKAPQQKMKKNNPIIKIIQTRRAAKAILVRCKGYVISVSPRKNAINLHAIYVCPFVNQ